MITGARADTDYIVTDFGVADHRYKDVHERAKGLTSVAHPVFREVIERD